MSAATAPEPQRLLSIPATAKSLDVSPDSVRRMIKDGDLRVVSLRRRVLVPVEEVDRLARFGTK